MQKRGPSAAADGASGARSPPHARKKLRTDVRSAVKDVHVADPAL